MLIRKIFLARKEYKILQNYLKGKDIPEKDLIFNLYKKGFLIKNKKEDDLLYKKAQELVKNWELKTLFLVVIDKCNFRCRYCFENLEKYSKSKTMSKETAKKAIRAFAKETRGSKSPKTIFFYGGEPLLNWEVVKASIQYAYELIKENK